VREGLFPSPAPSPRPQTTIGPVLETPHPNGDTPYAPAAIRARCRAIRRPSLPNGLRPWRAQEPPLSSALRLCRPAKYPCPSGNGIRLLHLPPALAWARAKACLNTNTAKSLKDQRQRFFHQQPIHAALLTPAFSTSTSSRPPVIKRTCSASEAGPSGVDRSAETASARPP
jgi:hypothetical protein